MMHLPLTQWRLEAENLPERLLDLQDTRAFTLPGADALSAFADLIGDTIKEDSAPQVQSVPYAVGKCFEEDLSGAITLSKEIDFGAMEGDRALLAFTQLEGRGEIFLGEESLACFGDHKLEELRRAYDLTGTPCAMAVDLTGFLHLGRKETLRLKFDDLRPAGMPGAAFLCVTARASLSRVSILPDEKRRMMTVRARISVQHAGRYVLRVQAVSGEAGKALPPARETDIILDAGEERGVQLALAVDAPVFESGRAYAAPALKIQLFARTEKEKGDGLLCDDALLTCGYAGPAPRAYVPLAPENCVDDPAQICRSIKELGVPAVLFSAPAPNRLYQAMTIGGISCVQHVSEEIRSLFTRWPCLTLCDAPPEEPALSAAAAAWQMAGSVAFPRLIDQTITDEEMLEDVTGRKLDQHDQGVCAALAWLRAVQIRLRAEAARQGRYEGALCAAQEIENRDIQDALRTAFAPVHLSALPLSGAWWTQTRFSASLEAFFPKESLLEGEISAAAILEDEEGIQWARLDAPCPRSGYIGVIEAKLPDTPCVLTLRCMLLRNGETIEESMLPVYVGERGPLEAAF